MADTIQVRRSAANGTYPSLAAGELAYSDVLPNQLAIGKVGGGNDIVGGPMGSIATKDFWTGTQAAYDGLGSWDADTIYFVSA